MEERHNRGRMGGWDLSFVNESIYIGYVNVCLALALMSCKLTILDSRFNYCIIIIF